MKSIEIYIDGASSGNPGPAGIGIVIYQDGSIFKKISRFIGRTTNNVAEYMAFIQALQEVSTFTMAELEIKTDSELLYKQLKGEYKVKHTNIKPLFEQVKKILLDFRDVRGGVSIHRISRNDNSIADKLAKDAIRKSKALEILKFKE